MAEDNSSHTPHSHIHADTAHVTKALLWGIVLNAAFVVVELLFGLLYNSMGLISDAGHNLSDVVSLVLALGAVKLSQVVSRDKYTYGYRKSTILVSLINAATLFVAIGIIAWESVDRLLNPRPVDGGVVAWVAGIGIFVNAFTAWLFVKDKRGDLNIKGAYLHMVADTLVSVGVLISGIVISFTGWFAVDPIIGLVVATIIAVSTWSLMREGIRLSLDGVPEGINVADVEKAVLAVKGVEAMHHLHIWAISTTENALTVHVVLGEAADEYAVKSDIKRALGVMGITHSTIETECGAGCCCDTDGCGEWHD